VLPPARQARSPGGAADQGARPGGAAQMVGKNFSDVKEAQYLAPAFKFDEDEHAAVMQEAASMDRVLAGHQARPRKRRPQHSAATRACPASLHSSRAACARLRPVLLPRLQGRARALASLPAAMPGARHAASARPSGQHTRVAADMNRRQVEPSPGGAAPALDRSALLALCLPAALARAAARRAAGGAAARGG
jgi:hypothetical protein